MYLFLIVSLHKVMILLHWFRCLICINRHKPVCSSRTNSCDRNLSRLITEAPSSSKPKSPSWKRPTESSSTRNTRATPPFETLKPNWPAWKRCEIYSEGYGLEIQRNIWCFIFVSLSRSVRGRSSRFCPWGERTAPSTPNATRKSVWSTSCRHEWPS